MSNKTRVGKLEYLLKKRAEKSSGNYFDDYFQRMKKGIEQCEPVNDFEKGIVAVFEMMDIHWEYHKFITSEAFKPIKDHEEKQAKALENFIKNKNDFKA